MIYMFLLPQSNIRFSLRTSPQHHTHVSTHTRTHARHWRPWKQNVDQSYKSCRHHLFLIRTLNFDKLTYCGFIVGKLQSGKPDRLENFYFKKKTLRTWGLHHRLTFFGSYLFTWSPHLWRTFFFGLNLITCKASSQTNLLDYTWPPVRFFANKAFGLLCSRTATARSRPSLTSGEVASGWPPGARQLLSWVSTGRTSFISTPNVFIHLLGSLKVGFGSQCAYTPGKLLN